MEPIEGQTIFDTVFNLCWLAATLAICHFVIASAGFLFIEADILRQGNEELLNSLDQGLVIVDKDDYDNVVFLNKAAIEIKSGNTQDSCLNMINVDSPSYLDKSLNLFA